MAASIATEFPPLPRGTTAGRWPANIHEAHNILQTNFRHGLTLLRQEGGDPIRLNQASERLVNDSVRILERMEESEVPVEYTYQCANTIGPLVFELEVAALAAEGVYVQLNLSIAPKMLTSVFKGKGRHHIFGTCA
jgi:hypothetical protein